MADKNDNEYETEEPRETVVVKDEKHSSSTGWIILAVVLIVILVLIFLARSVIDNNTQDIEAPTQDTNIQLPQSNPNPPTNPTEGGGQQ
ncbi:hypothetical protein KY385_03685 [Candidatus Parcubacteria bacterium]|nr:hypothetical protein [Candidatus Parcubacteria bacterium]